MEHWIYLLSLIQSLHIEAYTEIIKRDMNYIFQVLNERKILWLFLNDKSNLTRERNVSLEGYFVCSSLRKRLCKQSLFVYLKLHLIFHLRYLSISASCNISIAEQLIALKCSCSCLMELLKRQLRFQALVDHWFWKM